MWSSVKGKVKCQANYTVCAIDPSHISKTFNNGKLCELANTLCQHNSSQQEWDNSAASGTQEGLYISGLAPHQALIRHSTDMTAQSNSGINPLHHTSKW